MRPIRWKAQRLADSHRGKIQLLITDVVMPKLSGKELARSLTHVRPDLKVLYMSGYTDSAIVNSGILHKEVCVPAEAVHAGKPLQQGAGSNRRGC